MQRTADIITTDNSQYESRRLIELRKYNILDTLTEKDYENITFMASAICDVPIALISFVDETRQWFKSHKGLPASETPREYSFCAHAIKEDVPIFIVEDAKSDPRFSDNPLVTDDPKIIFYAGVTLVNNEGFALGTVCVIDRKKRSLSESQVNALKILSNNVMHLLELRKTNAELVEVKRLLETRNKDLEQFAMVVSHDIKSPLTTTLVASNMLESSFGGILGDEANKLIQLIVRSSHSIKSLVDGILHYYQSSRETQDYEKINVREFFDSFKQNIFLPGTHIIKYNLAHETLHFNKTQLNQIFLNLINNSIRYNDNDVAEINITFDQSASHYLFTVVDNGIGIAKENQVKIFDLFSTASVRDKFGVKGSGIGLPTIKKIIENAGGNIVVDSVPGKGTTFTFTIKKTA